METSYQKYAFDNLSWFLSCLKWEVKLGSTKTQTEWIMTSLSLDSPIETLHRREKWKEEGCKHSVQRT